MRFLIVDDSTADRELVKRCLQQEFPHVEFVEVMQPEELDKIAAYDHFDIVLTDYQLSWTTGLQILEIVKQRFPDVPVLMVTGTGSEEIAVTGLRSGLSNYILKNHLEQLPQAVHESLEKVHLQKQLQQSQRLESVGLLVSGIAHDFNNMLGGILGYTSRGLSRVTRSHPLYDNLYHIQEIGMRAASMTQQLLAFSRRQVLEPTDVNLNVVVENLLSFIGKILPDHIEIDFQPDPALKTVHVDYAQMEQVLMNLCVNAHDAMPDGGSLRISTSNAIRDEKPYVALRVQDSGSGMSEQVMSHIFEPFFTTKETGKGTGLGLSIVHGIIGQQNGFIDVQSIEGQGTTFVIYLPTVDVAGANIDFHSNNTPVQSAPVHGGTETILVVEDDPDLRCLMEEALSEYGYTMFSASDGSEGLRLFEERGNEIALIIFDLVTPKMKGIEMYDKIRQISVRPHFLFVSGYQANQISQNFVLDKGFAFLQKPFDLDELVMKVRDILDE